MQNYAANNAVLVTAQLINEVGEPLVPTALRWRVLDEADAVVVDWAALPVDTPGFPVITVEVDAAVNTLAAGVTRAIRRVEFEVTTAHGVMVIPQSYLLQTGTGLVFGVNTFLTHSQALLLSMEFASNYVRAWLQAVSKDDQEQALIHAHGRIVQLPLRMEFEDDQQRIIYHPWGRSRFEDLKPEQIADLHPRMLRALKRAQLIEAAYALTEDGVNAARKDGLMSMTVGESSQFFRPSKPLELGVCKDAYRELARWLDRTIRIGRA